MAMIGSQRYLWHAVDQDGDVVDALLQVRRDGKLAKRLLKRLLKSHRGEPRTIATDKPRRFGITLGLNGYEPRGMSIRMDNIAICL